jgi:hypothetical protein
LAERFYAEILSCGSISILFGKRRVSKSNWSRILGRGILSPGWPFSPKI